MCKEDIQPVLDDEDYANLDKLKQLKEQIKKLKEKYEQEPQFLSLAIDNISSLVVNLERKEVSQWIPSRPTLKSSNR